MPERVFSIEITILKYRILDILERVFALQRNIIEMQIVRAHHKIFALCGTVLHVDPAHGPSEFRGYDIRVLNGDISAFAKRLDPVHFRVSDRHMLCIPERCAAVLCHLTALDLKVCIMPEWIAQVEIAVPDSYISAFFQRALAVSRSVKSAVCDFNSVFAI